MCMMCVGSAVVNAFNGRVKDDIPDRPVGRLDYDVVAPELLCAILPRGNHDHEQECF